MKKLFDSILSIEDVKGIILFSFEGDIIFREFSSPLSEEPETKIWWSSFVDSLKGVTEADLVFEKSRFYIRKTEHGYLLVIMGVYAQTAMIRLNCDTMLSSLKQMRKAKGFKYLFEKIT